MPTLNWLTRETDLQGAAKIAYRLLRDDVELGYGSHWNPKCYTCACVKIIDSMTDVKCWFRNIARHPHSFLIPTATDKFYIDFVAKLNDVRILAVEYKGTHQKDSEYTKEKELVRQLWAKQSNGQNLFLMAFKTKDGMNTAQQIKQKIEKQG